MRFADWDEKEYIKELEDAVWDEPETALSMNDGHSDIHYSPDGSYKGMISRIVHENVKGAGSFPSKEDAMDLIQNAVAFAISDIAKWVLKGKGEFNDRRDYHTLALTVYMGDSEDTGINLDEKFREIKSHSVRLVLERSFEPGVPFGFFLKTAYPDTHEEHSEFTGRQFTKEEVVKGLCDFESEYQKLAFLLRDEIKGVSVHYGKVEHQEEYIRLRCGNPAKEQYTAYLNPQEGIKIYQSDKERRHPITPAELKRKCPQITEVIQIADEIIQEGEVKCWIADRKTLDALSDSKNNNQGLRSLDEMIKEVEAKDEAVIPSENLNLAKNSISR